MNCGAFRSASGLRPTTAFFGVAIVLVMVLVRTVGLCVDGRYDQPRTTRTEALPRPDFDILDREGRTLASSVKRIDVRMSPRAMWQAHTPTRMAERIAAVLQGGPGASELLAAMLPDAAEDGVVRVREEQLSLDFDAARRLQAWLQRIDLDGFWIERTGDSPRWLVLWQPALVLDAETRAHCYPTANDPGPRRWTTYLARELARCVDVADASPAEGESTGPDPRRREEVWEALLPTADHVLIEGLASREAWDLCAVLDEEGVEVHQMSVDYVPERRYPTRGDEPAADCFGIVGAWRYVDAGEALALAARERGLGDAPVRLADASSRLRQRVGEMLDHKQPQSGLEGLCARLLGRPEWAFLRPEPATYSYRRDWPVHHTARRYFFEDELESDTPRVVTTLDVNLQAFLRQQLEHLVEEHDPAVAMAIAVEVATGEVLAVDGISPYEPAEFLPTWHLFTPGSTFKVIAMATALDTGVVRPSDTFDTHDGHYNIPGSTRVIQEAEGAATGTVTAAEGLAFSVNAVLAQVGMRIPDRLFRERLVQLGYDDIPGSGVGVERRDRITSLPWKMAYTHASISFGHEILVSLWQHATALTTVLRGGVHAPLRVVSAVECAGRRHPVPAPQGRPVFGLEACEEVRRMMVLGAQIGTGDDLWRREVELGTPLALATKTGTAEKVGTEACLHLELERNRANRGVARDDPAFVTFDQIKGRPRPHRRACYTSSICALGSVPGSEREVMVLVVVDEPRGQEKFGSRVAGPAGIAILKEALGLTRGGRSVDGDAQQVPTTDYGLEANDWDQPWAAEWPAAEERR